MGTVQKIPDRTVRDGVLRLVPLLTKGKRTDTVVFRCRVCHGEGGVGSFLPGLFCRSRVGPGVGSLWCPVGNIARVILHTLQLPDDGAMIFPRQGQFLLLGKLPAERFSGCFQFRLFMTAGFPEFFHGFIETFGQEVVHALEQTGKTEFVVKEIDEIVRLELLSIRTCHNDSEPLLAAEGLGIAFKVHGEAPIGAEQYPGSGIARDLLHAAEQNILYFFAVSVRQHLVSRKEFYTDFFLVFFLDDMGVAVPVPDVGGVGAFRLGKTLIGSVEPLQPVAQTMLSPLMLGIQGFQLAKVCGKLNLHENQRIA